MTMRQYYKAVALAALITRYDHSITTININGQESRTEYNHIPELDAVIAASRYADEAVEEDERHARK